MIFFFLIFFLTKALLSVWTRGMGGWSSSTVASWAKDWKCRATYQRRGVWWGQTWREEGPGHNVKQISRVKDHPSWMWKPYKALLPFTLPQESNVLFTYLWQGHKVWQSCCRALYSNHIKSKFPLILRFQLRVALYIAASLGHLDLAGWLLERGVHAEEPVGVHPYRQWCHQTAHQGAGKSPIHAAAEGGQLLILKLFISRNLLSLACRDPVGRDPLKIAIQHGHRDCVRYLANKMCSVVSLPNISLPMRIYRQTKRWVSLGRRRVASNPSQYTRAPFKGRGGDMLLVDGFNQPQMSSKSRRAETKPRKRNRVKAVQHLPLMSKSLPSKRPPQQLPSLQSVNDFKETQKRWKQDVKHRDDDAWNKTEGDNRYTRLPPVTRGGTPNSVFVGSPFKSSSVLTASLESFSQHCGRTPRENAIYYLSIARSLYSLLCSCACSSV